MAEIKSFDCAETDLLCDEESAFDNGALVETFNDRNHQTNGNARSDSEPLILLPCPTPDCIGWMVEREREHLPRGDYLMRLRTGDLDLSLRRESLDWMIKACSHYNFGELCLYLAMNYMDRFLSVYNLPRGKTWTIQLVSVACLSLAAKFDEVDVPSMVDLQAGEPKYLFEGKTIQRMEILVLNYLKWNMKPYTPFNFIEYFIRTMNDDNDDPFQQAQLIARSIPIILSTIKGIDFLEFKASEIAAAVAAYVCGETRALDFDKAAFTFTLEKGRVVKCLELIKDRISIGSNGGNASSVPCSPNGVLDAACFSYKTDETSLGFCPNSSHTKRRKLDQHRHL